MSMMYSNKTQFKGVHRNMPALLAGKADAILSVRLTSPHIRDSFDAMGLAYHLITPHMKYSIMPWGDRLSGLCGFSSFGLSRVEGDCAHYVRNVMQGRKLKCQFSHQTTRIL
jgi:hypothetical protein